MAFDYDLFVIGGGSGGVRAARTAAATGAKVAVAEDSRMGGTCVIRGCVPKKLMVFASEFSESTALAREYGWSTQTGTFSWPTFQTKMHAELARLEGVYRKLLGNSDVEIYDSRARLSDAHTVALAEGRSVTAKHILVATGGRPVRPDLPNAGLGLVSDDIFDLPALPKSVLIIGGGYIACEFAGILNGLGVAVTQYYRGEQVLRGFDNEARTMVVEGMRAKGVDLHTNTNIAAMAPASLDGEIEGIALSADEIAQHQGQPVRVKSTNGEEHVFDHVFFATGRTPNSNGIGLEEAGIKLDRRGAVEVDAYSQTAVPSVYAIGDVTDRIALTPVAIREGVAFTETVFNGSPTKPDHALVPSAVFTQPEMGTVGLSEEDASAIEPVHIYSAAFKPMRMSFGGKADKVLMKLVVSQATDKVLGCHIVADQAGEMIQLAGIAVKMGATKADFDRTVAVHPTMSEELVTMKAPTRSA